METNDFVRFKELLYNYIIDTKKCNEIQNQVVFKDFVSEIQDLKCDDFRRYFYIAYYQNNRGLLDEAKVNIDKAIKQAQLITNDIYDIIENNENSIFLFVDRDEKDKGQIRIPLNHIHQQLADIFFCAGEIYSKLDLFDKALEYYKRYHYYNTFLKSGFSYGTTVPLYSFRRYNEYSIADLINMSITVSPSTMMNDPFDSVINLWATEDHLSCVCSEKRHIKPYHDSFGYYRIRSFCAEGNDPVYKNILMWSHYGDEHKGFCIRYNLSKHFICQEENDNYEHMYLKKITYSDAKIDIDMPTIDSNLAYATKMKQWEYENEIRLIVYNPNHKENFYSIELDKQSYIDAIYFGYRCPEQTIETIKNLFKKNYERVPMFYKMILNQHDIYNMDCVEI